MISSPRRVCALLVLASVSLTACSSRAVVPAAGGFAPTTDSIAALSTFTEATIPNIAGTYSGSITATENGKSITGTVVATLHQSGANFTGTAQTTFNKSKGTASLAGTVKRTKKGAFLKFTAFNPNGRNGTGSATVVGQHMNGKAYVPASGGQPAINFTYKTIKQ